MHRGEIAGSCKNRRSGRIGSARVEVGLEFYEAIVELLFDRVVSNPNNAENLGSYHPIKSSNRLWQLIILSNISIHDPLQPSAFLEQREQDFLFAIVVAADLLVPGQTVLNEVWGVFGHNVRSLKVDAVVTPYHDIMDQCHV